MAEDIQKIKISALPEALTVSDSDCFLIVQNRKAKRVKPSLMKGKKGDTGESSYLGVTATHIVWKLGVNGAWQTLVALASLIGPRGEKPVFRKVGGTLQMKYAGEPDSAYVSIFDREELKMKFADLTPAEVDLLRLHFSDLTQADKAELMKPATDAAARLNALSDHRDEIRDGYWWRWDEKTKEWSNTGEIAKGNLMYPVFGIDPLTGQLAMYADAEYDGAKFEIDNNGNLLVII